MSFLITYIINKDLNELKQGLEKISELVQPGESEDGNFLAKQYTEYINKGRI